jgi:hypothetical protein
VVVRTSTVHGNRYSTACICRVDSGVNVASRD